MKICTIIFVFVFTFNQSLLSSDTHESVISGIIQNYSKPTLTIDNKSVDLDPNGQFRYKLDLEKPSYVEVNYGKSFYLYLRPGDKIHLDLDAQKDITSTQLSGDGLVINEHLIKEEYQSAKTSAYFEQYFKDIVTLREKQYVQKINALWLPFEERFKNFISEHRISDAYFIRTQQAILMYSKALILMRYPDWYRHFSSSPGYQPSEDYFKFIDQLNLNDASLLDIDEYTDFLHQYLDYKSKEIQNKKIDQIRNNYRPFRVKIQVCMETFYDPQVRTEMLYPVMKSLLIEYYHKGIDDLIGIFRKHCKNPGYLNEIEQMIKNDQYIREKCVIKTYKKTGDVTLDAFIYMPPDIINGDKRPAIAFFHGGGWECGKPEWGYMQCKHFSSLGIVAISFEYRLETQHGTTPLECIADARSAIRWMRQNAAELNIDPNRIVASGFSAGGHIALCTVMIDRFDDSNDIITIDPGANAFLLWVTPAKIYDGIKPRLINRATVKDIDPASHIRPDLPPMVFFQGTVDNHVPPQSIREFVKEMKAAGNRCDLHIYEGQTHLGWGKNSEDVLNKMDDFLESIGYVQLKPK